MFKLKVFKRLFKVLLLFIVLCITFGIKDIKANSIMNPDYLDIYSLATQKLNTNDVDTTILQGFNDVDRFYLFETHEDGYYIYDRLNDIYIEYSNEGVSPYHDQDGILYYIGPTYYFKKVDNALIDLYSNEEVSNEEYDALVELDLENKEIILMNKELENFQEEDMTNVTNITSDEHEHHQHSASASESSLVEIPYAFYFENLKDNMGSNTATSYSGSCTFVALEMILSYYDSVISDDIIPENFDVTTSKYFSSFESIYANEYTQSPGFDNNFHAYNIENVDSDMELNMLQARNLMKSYLDGANISYYEYKYNAFDLYWQWANPNIFAVTPKKYIQQGIDSGNPVYVCIGGIDEDIRPDLIGHAVTAYAYDDDGIWANFGWKSGSTPGGYSRTKAKFNSYIIGRVLYYDVYSPHTHSYNYEFSGTGGVAGTLCICGDKECNHDGNTTYISIGDVGHKEYCGFCETDFNPTHPHHYVNGICVDCHHTHKIHSFSHLTGVSGNHYTQCTVCGLKSYCTGIFNITLVTDTSHTIFCIGCKVTVTYEHVFDDNNICTVCGYAKLHEHEFTDLHQGINKTQHRSYCSCGVFEIKSHIAVLNPKTHKTVCRDCGWDLTLGGGGIVIVMNKKTYLFLNKEEELWI